jgi:hypothetical protein
MGCGFTDIARKDQPIGRTTRYTRERPLVDLITQMKIAYRIQFHTACPLRWPWTVIIC